jgi:DNA-binding IclR family transcriptional regulator
MRTLDILELFLDGDSHSAPEITQRLGLPRTTVHELVHTLAQRSYLVPQPERPGHYRLGVPCFQLGSVFAEHLDLAREGRLVSEQVAAACGETVHVAILEDTDVVYIAKVDSSHPVRLVSAVGRRLYAHCTAIGKMMLAMLPDGELDSRYPDEAELPSMTANSITSPARLREHLAEIRQRAVAFEFCESNEAAACVAAPVRDASGEVVSAMSISVPTARWDDHVAEKLAAQVCDGAAELSTRLGCRPPVARRAGG